MVDGCETCDGPVLVEMAGGGIPRVACGTGGR